MRLPGVIYDDDRIRLMILFALITAKKPITRAVLCNIIMYDALAEYFSILENLSALISADLVVEHGHKETDIKLLYITDYGKETFEELKQRLALSVREKIACSALKAMSNYNRENSVIGERYAKDDGYIADLTLMEGKTELMKLSVFVPNELQSAAIIKHFKSHPEIIYKTIIDALTVSGDEEEKL